MTKLTGNFGYLESDGRVIHVTQWNAQDKAGEEDGMTTADEGFEHPEAVSRGLQVTVNGFWDADSILTTGAGALFATKVIDNGKFFVGLPSSNKVFGDCPFLVTEFSVVSMVKGLIKFTATLKTQGPYSLPS